MNERKSKLTSIDAFMTLKARLAAHNDTDAPTIVIPAGTCCQASGANLLIRAAKGELLQKKLADKVHLRITGATGSAPWNHRYWWSGATFYPKVNPDDSKDHRSHNQRGGHQGTAFRRPGDGRAHEKQDHIPFFRKQVRTVIGRNEKVDPIRILDYIENDGYQSLVMSFPGDPRLSSTR